MAKRIQHHHHPTEPKTQMEAVKMIAKLWGWLLKKNPTIFIPLTFWMLFGGGIFLYNYVSSDKVSIKDATPLGQNTEFSIMPKAVAGGSADVPIIFNNKLWGYEDTTFIAKVDNSRSIILVYNKITKEVKQVEFDTNFKLRFKKY